MCVSVIAYDLNVPHFIIASVYMNLTQTLNVFKALAHTVKILNIGTCMSEQTV